MQSLLRQAGRARRTIDDVGEDNEKWGFVAHYTYSYDLLLLLLLVMMTMVHNQSGTVCLLLCVLLELDGVVQNNFSGNIHTLNVTSSSTY